MARTEGLMPLLEERKSYSLRNFGSSGQTDFVQRDPIQPGIEKDQSLEKRWSRGLSFANAARPSICAALLITIPIATALFSSGLFLLLCLSQWHSENAGSATGELQSAHQPDLFGPAFRASPVHSKSRVVEADIGIVAADDERCSIIGRNALRDGGNAVDAAVATTLCLGVVSPESSGLGGGAFMLVRMSTGQTIAYDMRESAPGAASEDMYADDPNAKSVGALSIGVPGELAGLYLAWRNHGMLPWKKLVYPAFRVAYNGFEVTPYLALKIANKEQQILSHGGLAEFLAPNGTILAAGEICHRRQLAKTLELIARFGPRAFYRGSIAVKLVKDVQEAGGILSLQDLANYQVRVRKAIHADVMNYTVIGMPPPSSGGAAMILILNILAGYKEPSDALGTLGLHRMVEAFKHAYAIRMRIGDPDFVNVTGIINDMLSPQFASLLQQQIVDSTTFPANYYGGKWNQLNDHGTSHLSIVDGERNAVSLTSTVNDVFGSLIVSSSTGILLNNEMDDFAIPTDNSPDKLPPAKENFIRPYKRPLSSMAPTIVLKGGQVVAVTGASGGSKIITATEQVLLNHLVKGLDPLTSVLLPRVHHQLAPNVVQYENWTLVTGDHIELAEYYIAALKEKGHELESKSTGAIVQLVVQDLSRPAELHPKSATPFFRLIGVSDLRKDGVPAGL